MINDGSSSRAQRLGGMLRLVLLTFALSMVGMIMTAAKAEAHGLHTQAISPDTDGYTDGIGDALKDDLAPCDTICCSSAACAPALLSLDDPSPKFDAGHDRLSRPSDARASGSQQGALRRPPRV